jgi:rifampicin phosphotransferase
VFASLAFSALAQLARKPSFYDQQKQAPAQRMAKPGSQSSLNLQAPGSRSTISNQTEFDQLARTYDFGTSSELAHVLFVIDLKTKPYQIYYLDTPRYQLHIRFVRETGLAPNATDKTVDQNYLIANRRFMFGTLSWQKNISSFTYEFWEGDQVTPELLAKTDASVKASFFAPVMFKANSTLHEARAQKGQVKFVTQEALIREQPYVPLNKGQAIGKIRVLESIDQINTLGPDDIAVLRQVPISLPPVAGVLTERPSTALSHVNLLAKGWGVPNAYVKDVAAAMRQFEGLWVQLSVTAASYAVRALSEQEIIDKPVRVATSIPAGQSIANKPDLTQVLLMPLASLRAKNSVQCGSKAANLGQMNGARIGDTVVPDGFCIPFSQYDRFARQNKLSEKIELMQQLPGFATDPKVRQQALAALRDDIVLWPVDASTAASWRARWQSQLAGRGVFVRSSSNSEDLPGFSGAGLYSTIPNVTTGDGLELAVKKVWASVFNPEAWEARVAAGFGVDAVWMAVFVQTAINSTNSGVMITRDPFDASHQYITYISAKRGIGIRVVEGQRIAEQVMYSSWSKAIQVISRSADDKALQLNSAGGVTEVPLEQGRKVLSDALVLRLASMGAKVKRLFGEVDQDIEWATLGDQIILLQARPYIERRGGGR